MATNNVFYENCYQINQSPIALTDVTQIGLPSGGVLVGNCIGSPTRYLSTGVNVYSFAQVVATGNEYYFKQTFAELVALVNA